MLIFRDGAGYRVQCQACGTEQHAECVKYDIKDPYRGEYFCPHCWVQRDKVESGATLIVSPSSISFQWIEEMQKHIKHKDIKMLFYKGAKDNGYIQPRTLGRWTIVSVLLVCIWPIFRELRYSHHHIRSSGL